MGLKKKLADLAVSVSEEAALARWMIRWRYASRCAL